MGNNNFDIAIVGSGVAARTVAGRCRAAGRSVAVIDERPFGGTCMLRGCDPKKLLRAGAAAFDRANSFYGKGLDGHIETAWAPLMAFKRAFTEPQPEQQQDWYRRIGAVAMRGRARFSGPNSLQIDSHEIRAAHMVIAAGARPMPLPFDGGKHVATSDDFLDLDALPRRIAFVGGGYVAAELSTIAALMGAEVVVVQRGPRMLKGFDPALVARLMDRFRELGIVVETETTVRAVASDGTGYTLETEATKGRRARLSADLVVHAAGRAPAIDGLDLPRGGVEVVDGGLALNDFLQSRSNPAVYAAGDAAAQGPPVTPVAALDGEAVAENLLHGNRRRPDYHAVPRVVFTLPPLARVGLDEDQARARNLDVRVIKRDASEWFTARAEQEPVYASKVLVEKGTERILGAHVLGPRAEETIGFFALAMRHELTAPMLKDTVFGYPTAASDVPHML